jgi:hypothetical protein
MLPFTREQFLAVFVAHNLALWPLQIVAGLLGVAIVWALSRPRLGRSGRALVGAGLAAMWLATGIGYHALHFAPVNSPAWGFAALFVVQAVLLGDAVLRDRMQFEAAAAAWPWIGWGLVLYALVGYPAIGLATGLDWAELPAFGLAPCPVTLFTTGCLMLSSHAVPRRLLVIPLLWSAIGGSAAVLLGMPQDWVLFAGGLLLLMAWRRGRPGVAGLAA